MTSFDTTLRVTGFAIAPRLTRAIEFAVSTWNRAATRRSLRGLSDQALEDIGLTRWEVEHRF